MTNYEYEKLYKSFLFGIKVAEIMKVKWFGQPSGLMLGSDIIEDKLNFLCSWIMKKIITMDIAEEIYKSYYQDLQTSEIVCLDDEEHDIDFAYTFTEEDFENAKQAFHKIYECKIPIINR